MLKVDWRLIGALLATVCMFVIGLASPSDAVPPDHLYTMTIGSYSASNKLTLTSLQGLVAQTKPQIWLKRSETNMWLTELENDYGITTTGFSSVGAFIDHFRSYISGYVLCDVGTDSQNVAASLAGAYGGIVLTPENESLGTSRGIPLLKDVRGMDDNWLYTNYWYMFNKSIAFEQKTNLGDLCSFLYDTAAYNGAMTWYQGTDTQSSFRRTLASSLDRHSPVLGWAADTYEAHWIRDLSQSGTGGVAADGWHNGSVLSQLPIDLPIKQKTHFSGSPSTEDNVHYVSFIITDGDNIQWYERDFYNNSRWWASPYRGTFNLGWEMNPILTDQGSLIMKKLYDTASSGTHKDYFISSPFGNMLMSPELYPDVSGYAQRLKGYLTNADLSIVNVIFYNSATYETLNPVMDLSNVWGIVVKASGGNYAAGNGYIYWRSGKPAVNYKYFISSGYATPSSAASAINGRPRSPKTNQESYTLVAVNSWNAYPLQDVSSCISQLNSAVRVVTPEVFFYHLRKNFGTSVSGPGNDTTSPSTPTSLSTTAMSSSVAQVKWTASTDNVAVNGYRVYRNGSIIGKTKTRSYTDSGLTPGTTYTYTVVAFDTSGNSSAASSPVQVTTLQPQTGKQWLWRADNRSGPSGSRVSYFTDGVTTFTENNCSGGWAWYWDNPGPKRTSLRSSGTSTVGRGFMDSSSFGEHFDVSKGITVAARVRPITVSSNGCLCLSINNSSTAGWGAGSAHVWVGWHDDGLKNGKVGFWNRSGTEVRSFESSVNFRGLWTTWTLSAVRIGNDVAWDLWIEGEHQSPTQQASNGTWHTLVYNNSTDMGTSVRIGQRRNQATEHNTAWQYLGITNRGVVPAWNGTSDVTPPSVPANVQAVTESSTSIRVSWNASTDNVSSPAYRVYRDGVFVSATASTTFIDTGLTPGTSHSYAVSAYDAAGNHSPKSSPPVVAVAEDTVAPSVPGNVGAVALSPSVIGITWDASTDDSGVSGYRVFRNGSEVGTSTTTSYSDSGLSEGTAYSYTVSAYDEAANESAQSSPSAVASTMIGIDIAAAKQLADSVTVGLSNKVVIAVFPDCIYIEEIDRYAGIKVVPIEMPAGIEPGKTVDVGGTLQTSGGERCIINATVTLKATGSVDPLGMNNFSVGGGNWLYDSGTGEGQRGIAGRVGTNNIGLLIKIWGSYVHIDSSTFSVNDGSGSSVRCAVPSFVTLNDGWQYVAVTGISSCYEDQGELNPLVLVRQQEDIVIIE